MPDAPSGRLPGLATYARVADWREGQIAKQPNIAVFRDEDDLGFTAGFERND